MRPLKKGTPGKGGGAKLDSFSYTPVAFGTRNWFNAWLAGPPYWAMAHEHKKETPGTKPCLTWMTDGEVRCKRCRPQNVATWIGWVPLYRAEDGQPIMLIVHESTMDLLAPVKFLDYCLCGRVGEKSSVFVKKSDKAMSFLTTNEQRKKPRDITCDLLNMWGLPELEEWLMGQRSEVPTVPVKSDGEPFSPMTAAAALKYAPEQQDARRLDAEYRATVNRMKQHMQDAEASTNGKHEPK